MCAGDAESADSNVKTTCPGIEPGCLLFISLFTCRYAKLASMAEDTAIRMVLAFVILLISSLYLFNDNTTIHFSTSGLQLVDALYRYGGNVVYPCE